MIVSFAMYLLSIGLDQLEESYAIQEKQLERSQLIISQSGASLSLQTLLNQIISFCIPCIGFLHW